MIRMLRLVPRSSSRHLRTGKPYLFEATTRSDLVVPNRHRILGNSASSSSDAKPCSTLDSKQISAGASPVAKEWRKQQLDKIEKKFKGNQLEARSIESEEDLQPMWKEMEGRVTRRKPRTLAQTGGKVGRMNIKKTDEDVWLEQGLYSTGDDTGSKTE